MVGLDAIRLVRLDAIRWFAVKFCATHKCVYELCLAFMTWVFVNSFVLECVDAYRV